ncbi:MAG: hypothetical protein CMF49_04390 [Legionellales bacterium]|nr:hypothetical protein [Legionellales bacterium]
MRSLKVLFLGIIGLCLHVSLFANAAAVDVSNDVTKPSSLSNQTLNPGLSPAAVGETSTNDAIPITTKSKDVPSTRNGINQKAGFSSYDYLSHLKNCEPGTIEAGADAVTIKGYQKGRCHVIYSIAGRKVDCRFSQAQLKQLASEEKIEQAKNYDRGVGLILRPLGTDDISSPLSTCIQ